MLLKGVLRKEKKKQVFSQKEVFLAPEINLHLLTKEKQAGFAKITNTQACFFKSLQLEGITFTLFFKDFLFLTLYYRQKKRYFFP